MTFVQKLDDFLVNPSRDQFVGYISRTHSKHVKGIITLDGKVLMADAYFHMHEDIIRENGLIGRLTFFEIYTVARDQYEYHGIGLEDLRFCDKLDIEYSDGRMQRKLNEGPW